MKEDGAAQTLYELLHTHDYLYRFVEAHGTASGNEE